METPEAKASGKISWSARRSVDRAIRVQESKKLFQGFVSDALGWFASRAKPEIAASRLFKFRQ